MVPYKELLTKKLFFSLQKKVFAFLFLKAILVPNNRSLAIGNLTKAVSLLLVTSQSRFLQFLALVLTKRFLAINGSPGLAS